MVAVVEITLPSSIPFMKIGSNQARRGEMLSNVPSTSRLILSTLYLTFFVAIYRIGIIIRVLKATDKLLGYRYRADFWERSNLRYTDLKKPTKM